MKNSSSRSFPRVSVSFLPSQSHCAHDSTLGLPLGIPMTEGLQAGFATKYIPLWTPAAIDYLAEKGIESILVGSVDYLLFQHRQRHNYSRMASANTSDIPSSRDRIDCNNLEMELSVLRSNAEPLSRPSVSFYDREITRNGRAILCRLIPIHG